MNNRYVNDDIDNAATPHGQCTPIIKPSWRLLYDLWRMCSVTLAAWLVCPMLFMIICMTGGCRQDVGTSFIQDFKLYNLVMEAAAYKTANAGSDESGGSVVNNQVLKEWNFNFSCESNVQTQLIGKVVSAVKARVIASKLSVDMQGISANGLTCLYHKKSTKGFLSVTLVPAENGVVHVVGFCYEYR